MKDFMSDIMLKYRFLKNSAKVLYISTAILFLSNAILLLSLVAPDYVVKIGFLSKLPDLSVYIFTFLAFLALNDEKAAHRKIKDIKSQKKVSILKVFLILVFIANFLKTNIQKILLNMNNSFVDVISNVFLVVSSFSFFMFLLSCWYFYRDRKEGNLKVVSFVSGIVSFGYAIYKFIVYQFVSSPALHESIITDETKSQILQYIICLVQYAINIIMLVLINKYYEKKEAELESAEKDSPKKNYPEILETLETEDGFGIDFVDDYKNNIKTE